MSRRPIGALWGGVVGVVVMVGLAWALDSRGGAAAEAGASGVAAAAAWLHVQVLMMPVTTWCARAGITVPVSRCRRWASVVSGVVAAGVPWCAAGPVAIVWLMVLPTVVTAASIDAFTHRMPTPLLWWAWGVSAVSLVVASALGMEPSSALRALAAGLTAGAVLLVLAVVSAGGVGMADVRLAVPLGVVSGAVSWTAAVWSVVIGPLLLMFPVAVWLIIVRRGRRDSVLAAGPAMVAATVLVIGLSELRT